MLTGQSVVCSQIYKDSLLVDCMVIMLLNCVFYWNVSWLTKTMHLIGGGVNINVILIITDYYYSTSYVKK